MKDDGYEVIGMFIASNKRYLQYLQKQIEEV